MKVHSKINEALNQYEQETGKIPPPPVAISSSVAKAWGIYDRLVEYEGGGGILQIRYRPDGAPLPKNEEEVITYKDRKLILEKSKNKYYTPIRLILDHDLGENKIRLGEDSIYTLEDNG